MESDYEEVVHLLEGEIAQLKIQLTKQAVCTLMCLHSETPITIYFPFVPNGKFMVLGAPILKFTRVNIRIRILLAIL